MSTGEGPIASFGIIPPGEVKSDWGSEWEKSGAELARPRRCGEQRGGAPGISPELPDLDPTYTDKHGDPLLRLTLDWTDHERAQGKMLTTVQAAMGRAMNARVGNANSNLLERYTVTQYQSTHVNGGVIMGSSPDTSALNSWMQHWQIPNLWVMGGSAFPQNGSGNPTLTILATTLRAADALVDRDLKNPGRLV
jgi:gluconate 2-dehydrogenase alpha chain